MTREELIARLTISPEPPRIVAILPTGNEVEINAIPDGAPLPAGLTRLEWRATEETMSEDAPLDPPASP